MTVISLGPVDFADFEIPEKVEIPGKVKIAKLVNIGGKRNPQVMGTDDGNIKFSGMMRGADAQDRSTMLQGMKNDQLEIAFQCGAEFRMVTIEVLDIVYHAAYEIYYTIELYITQDPSADAGPGVVSALLSSVVGPDVASIVGVIAGAAPSPGLSLMSTAMAGVAAIPSLDAAMPFDLAPLVPPINSAVTTLQGEIAAADALINAGPNSTTMPQMVSSLTGISAGYDAQLAKLNVVSCANRIVTNLSQAGAA